MKKNRAKVLEFYNEHRRNAQAAEPNEAHLALVELEKAYEVHIITQNVDDLHERAGSTNVLHLHGELNKARSSFNTDYIVPCLGDQQLADHTNHEFVIVELLENLPTAHHGFLVLPFLPIFGKPAVLVGFMRKSFQLLFFALNCSNISCVILRGLR